MFTFLYLKNTCTDHSFFIMKNNMVIKQVYETGEYFFNMIIIWMVLNWWSNFHKFKHGK